MSGASRALPPARLAAALRMKMVADAVEIMLWLTTTDDSEYNGGKTVQGPHAK